MRGRARVFLCLIIAAAASGLRPADAQARAAQEPPMIFFVAKGAANSCGPGCSEWIAAEGRFDENVSLRFKAFIGSLGDRNLPIYFNSEGGVIGEARVMGRSLRHRKMTAAVGKTMPEGCRGGDNEDPACRKIMQSSTVVNARLSAAEAVCYSSCFYALVGASIRHVPKGAKLGIHGSRPTARSIATEKAGGPTSEQLKAGRRQYLIDMGVDPGVADLSEKFPPETMHILTRDEIARFRVESPTKQ